MTPFPYIFSDVVDGIRKQFDKGLKKPFYEFGTYLELTKVHKLKDSNRLDKYPLVWLVWEANENVTTYTAAGHELSPRIFICTATNSDYRSRQRYEMNFITTLYPILDLLIASIKATHSISTDSIYDYTVSDHLYWGESLGYAKQENVLFDTLDAIELKFNNLELLKKC